jgi:hypothetical protein
LLLGSGIIEAAFLGIIALLALLLVIGVLLMILRMERKPSPGI